jgi:hypothetical protein
MGSGIRSCRTLVGSADRAPIVIGIISGWAEAQVFRVENRITIELEFNEKEPGAAWRRELLRQLRGNSDIRANRSATSMRPAWRN